MELTVDQALQQGVAAQSEGRPQDAEQLYRAILQTQPNHPDANHNLGLLAVAVGKLLEAIPLFKLALDANPKIDQFWLSYIDALIKTERFDMAKRALVEGEKSGVSLEELDALKQRLQPSVPNDTNKTVKAQRLSEKRKKLAERKKSKKRKARDAEPSQDQVNLLLGHYQAGRLAKAEQLATSLNQQFPRHPFAWKVLGTLLNQTGRLNESLTAMRKSVELSPNDAETLSNLGNTLKDLDRLEEAEVSHRKAIACMPQYNKAHNNLAITLKKLGRLEEAEASIRQAIVLEPNYAVVHTNLGNILQELGRLDEAEASHRQAITLKPDYAESHNNLGVTLKELGRLKEAEVSHRQAIALKPDYASALSNLGNILKELGRLDEAEASYRRAIQFEPDDGRAVHMLAALTATNTARAPLDYVENLFDGYAAKFDSSLVGQLGYQIPKVIAELIARNSESDNLGSVLDLGCGTGMVGIEISQMCDRIEGLDVSRNMLREAQKTGLYDHLVKQDLESYLSNEVLNFDYFVATDVFVYLGELAEVFESIQSRNKSSGKLVFSVEHKDGDGFALQQTGRYAHSKPYIASLCKTYHYKLDYFEVQNLRLEGGSYIRGGLYLLSF